MGIGFAFRQIIIMNNGFAVGTIQMRCRDNTNLVLEQYNLPQSLWHGARTVAVISHG